MMPTTRDKQSWHSAAQKDDETGEDPRKNRHEAQPLTVCAQPGKIPPVAQCLGGWSQRAKRTGWLVRRIVLAGDIQVMTL